MLNLVQQVRHAQRAQRLSVASLLKRSRLAIDRSSLQRKLQGSQPMTVDECQALAAALGISLAWQPSRAA